MHKPTSNYNQLIELAILDAYGLLDSIESDLYNSAFHEAPVALQEEIIGLQEALALDDALLPKEVPPAKLKKQVIKAVAEAADKEANRLAPLALIGARTNKIGLTSLATKQILFWRATAMVFLGAAIVLAILSISTQKRVSKITEIALNTNTADAISEIAGARFLSFINNPYCYVTQFERHSGDTPGYIRIAVHERTGEGYIIAVDLKKNEEILIEGKNSEGKIIEIARLSGDSAIVGREFQIDPALTQSIRFLAKDAATGQIWG